MNFKKTPKVDIENKPQVPTFDEIIFEFRNKEYGAFFLRKKYNKYMTIALSIGIVIAICTALTTSFLSAKATLEREELYVGRNVIGQMGNLDLPMEYFAPPPPPSSSPPPMPPEEDIQQQRFIPPIVVDLISLEDETAFLAFDDIREEFVDRAVDEIIGIGFGTGTGTGIGIGTGTGTGFGTGGGTEIFNMNMVEVMPEFPGGDAALRAFIGRNTNYPRTARENGIHGKVYISFVVEMDGSISNVRVSTRIHPLLDNEALRVIGALPKFKPGTQGGKPVRVSYSVPINFVIG